MDELELSQMCKKKRRSLACTDVQSRLNLNVKSEPSSNSNALSSSDEIRTAELQDDLQGDQHPNQTNECAIGDPVEVDDESLTSRLSQLPCDECDLNGNQNLTCELQIGPASIERKDSGVSVASIESFRLAHVESELLKPKKRFAIEGVAADTVLEEQESCESPTRPASTDRKDSGISVASIESFRLANVKSEPPKPKKSFIIEKQKREMESKGLRQSESAEDCFLRQKKIVGKSDALQSDGNRNSTHQNQYRANMEELPTDSSFNRG